MGDAVKLWTAIGIMAFAGAASAHLVMVGEIEIIHVWAEPSDGDRTRVFATIANDGRTPATLLKMTTDAAKRVEIRQRGRVLDQLTVPAEDAVVLGEEGFELALVGLTSTLEEGEKFSISVTFEGYRAVELPVLVGEKTKMPQM